MESARASRSVSFHALRCRALAPVACALTLALTLALALAGGADAQLLDCLGGQRPGQMAELIFGRNIGRRLAVNEADWSRFVDREIISRFPSGLTMFNAAGEWRDDTTKKIIREPSKVVQIVLPGQAEDIAAQRDRRGLQAALQAAIGRDDRAAGLRVV
jgi:hypothetical protein